MSLENEKTKRTAIWFSGVGLGIGRTTTPFTASIDISGSSLQVNSEASANTCQSRFFFTKLSFLLLQIIFFDKYDFFFSKIMQVCKKNLFTLFVCSFVCWGFCLLVSGLLDLCYLRIINFFLPYTHDF